MSDALDRLKRKKRPKVQPRTTRVDQESRDIQIPRHTDTSVSKASEATSSKDSSDQTGEGIQISRRLDSHEFELSDHVKLQDASDDASKDIQIPRHTDIKVSRLSSPELCEGAEALDVKRSTFRLEVGLIGRMQRLCQDHKISREVMIESMFEYMERNPEALEEVINVAEVKNAYRQQLANRKRAKAMIEKFGQ